MEKKTKLDILEVSYSVLIVFGLFGLGLLSVIFGVILLGVWYWYKKRP